MKRSLLLITMLSILSLALVSPASAVLQYYFYGATLGEDWEDFPTKLVPNIEGTPGNLEALSVTLPIYLVWENVNGTQAEVTNGPIPITDLSWWDDDWDSAGFQYGILHNDDFDDDYKDCSSDISVSLNVDGELTVTDENFGGIGSNTMIQLRWCFSGLDGPCTDEWVVVIQWDRPATYYDADLASDVDAEPADVVVVEEEIDSGQGGGPWDLFIPQQTVEWVSTDARKASDFAVDSSDLAALAGELGNSVVWGFDSDGGRDSLNFHVDFAPFGNSADLINSSDITAYAADAGDQCSSSKAGSEEEVAAMFNWFGIGPTGKMVYVNGQLLPEYDVFDEEKLQNAINDPDGYLNNVEASAVTEVPWGQVKTLYR